MSFKTRKISQRPRLKPFKKAKQISFGLAGLLKNMPSKTRSYVVAGILILLAGFVVFRVTSAAYNIVSNWSPKNLLFAIGSDLKKDEHGYTNILLLGDGGHKRDGADLIDTIMVASIDYQKNSVSLFSIPRDFYVKADKTLGNLYSGKINEVYRNNKKTSKNEDGRFQIFKKVVGSLVNLDIQYYLRVDFRGFAQVVDSLGGITVEVKNDIYDPFYPNEEDDGYDPFTIKKGLQEMNGETALKFVRSRHTTSDFDRSARQQIVIQAIQQKALSKDILTSATALEDLYNAIKNNLNTDLSLREMISLGGFAKQMDHSHVVRKLIHDDPGQEGGLLYTPDKQLYNGEFVLIPFEGDENLIHKYTDLVFNHREFFYEPTKIRILNATKISGIANKVAYQFNRFGLDVEEIDNYKGPDNKRASLEKSSVFYSDYSQDSSGLVQPKYQTALDVLGMFFKATPSPSPDAILLNGKDSKADRGKKVYEGLGINFTIILGNDYKDFLVN